MAKKRKHVTRWVAGVLPQRNGTHEVKVFKAEFGRDIKGFFGLTVDQPDFSTKLACLGYLTHVRENSKMLGDTYMDALNKLIGYWEDKEKRDQVALERSQHFLWLLDKFDPLST